MPTCLKRHTGVALSHDRNGPKEEAFVKALDLSNAAAKAVEKYPYAKGAWPSFSLGVYKNATLESLSSCRNNGVISFGRSSLFQSVAQPSGTR